MTDMELKAYIAPTPDGTGLAEYYLKSEADKVIAELKNEIEVKKRLLNMALASVPNALKVMKIIQHHKYKRCLAMAEACMHKRWRPDEGFDYARSTRHMKKWLELAEEFKEADQ